MVSQRYGGVDFNVPSKLMNFIVCGLPMVAAVRPDSDVADIGRASEGGWVTETEDTREFATLLASVLGDARAGRRLGEAALRFARAGFDPTRLASQFEEMLLSATAARDDH